MNEEPASKTLISIVVAVVAVIVTGYFIGLQSPMKSEDGSRSRVATGPSSETDETPVHNGDDPTENIVNSVEYASFVAEYRGPTAQWKYDLSNLNEIPYDPMQEIVITEGEKQQALMVRASRRAFNGAPPTVPHKIDQMTSAACVACHVDGAKTDSLRIPVMSHAFYENCSQCHVEQNSAQFDPVVFRNNSFVGLPAPGGGSRAYPGAPPLIPHSTWMRENCLSCHGFTGQSGLRTTHPWRQNCQQCHGSSSSLEQALSPGKPQFLPPPAVMNKDEISD